MRIDTIYEAYRALHGMNTPCRLMVIQTADPFFLHDCLARYKQMWSRLSGSDMTMRSVSLVELLQHASDIREPSLCGGQYVWMVSCGKQKKTDSLLACIQQATSDHFFLLYGEEIAQDCVAYADTVGVAILLPARKPWEKIPFVEQWIKGFCTKHHNDITPESAALLAASFCDDRYGLVQELDKLLLYRPQQIIRVHDIEAIGWLDEPMNMWQLLDGLLFCDAKTIAHICHGQEWNLFALLRFLRNQFEKLIIACENQVVGRTKAQQKQSAQVARLGVDTLAVWMVACHDQEIQLRSGVTTPDMLLPFLIKMISSRAAA